MPHSCINQFSKFLSPSMFTFSLFAVAAGIHHGVSVFGAHFNGCVGLVKNTRPWSCLTSSDCRCLKASRIHQYCYMCVHVSVFCPFCCCSHSQQKEPSCGSVRRLLSRVGFLRLSQYDRCVRLPTFTGNCCFHMQVLLNIKETGEVLLIL